MPEHRGVPSPEIGISKDNPYVLEAVRLFEARNKIIDRAVELDEQLARTVRLPQLSQTIKDFLQRELSAFVIDIDERVVHTVLAVEDAVRYFVAAHAVEGSETHQMLLPDREHLVQMDQAAATYERVQQESPFMRKDLLHPLRRRLAHRRMTNYRVAAEERMREQAASFLVAARAHWDEAQFNAYNQRLDYVQDLISSVHDIGVYKNGKATAPTVVLKAREAELLFEHYILNPNDDRRASVRVSVGALRALAEYKPEEIASRVAMIKLRLQQAVAEVAELIEARRAVSAASISSEVAQAADTVQHTYMVAAAWLDDLIARMNSSDIAPERHHIIVSMLTDDAQVKELPEIRAVYSAIAAMRAAAQMPAPPKLPAPPLYPQFSAPAHERIADAGDFDGMNETEARRLGLERVKLRASKEAQNLLERIFNQQSANRFDVANNDDKIAADAVQRFVDEWKQKVPNIPVPCVPGSATAYLKRLAQGNIIKNLVPNKKITAIPNFDKPITLWIENWQEADYTDNKVKNAVSPLLQELGVQQSDKKVAAGVVNISREAVDEALWSGDPSTKTKTPKHTALLVKLGLNPARYNFRLIAQDEYARLAGAGKNFGKSNLWTWFNDYLVVGADVHGLSGGFRGCGGPSYVDFGPRDYAAWFLAVRLVLECNK